ncbi:FecCD family ABC transporter permease [Glutamicibacter sp. NPDC087344]|uniref:FecCD family ABC transporter permease n=1 Tax=Glutamicibacter sp. NPDC087344 TaxID=3363994 RepID=UPI00381D7241
MTLETQSRNFKASAANGGLQTRSANARRLTIILGAAGILVLASLLAVGIGSVHLNLSETVKALTGLSSGVEATIVWDLRIPRIALALLIGANLAASGALLQSAMHNPLADPGLTGVSSGASVCVLFILLVAPQHLSMLPVAAMVGGSIATVMVFAFAWDRSKGVTPIRVILAGVAVNSVFGGITGLLSLLNSDKLPSAMSWMNGSLAGKGLSDAATLLPYSLVGWVLLICCIRPANVLRLGAETAHTLGQDLTRTRLLLCGTAVYLASISISTVGIIGFVGLVVPHMAKLIVGSNARFYFPLSLLFGALVLLLADTLGRSLVPPLEIPAGIVMAVAGGPYFLYLLRRSTAS